MAERDWTRADIPSQAGCVAPVTGASSGLGTETALALAVRDPAKGARAAQAIMRIHANADLAVRELDTARLAGVRCSDHA